MGIKHLIVGIFLTNCYLLFSKDEVAVIDPGGGLAEILKEIDVKKLKYIILTHSHLDHTLVALKLKEKTKAEILIHKKEDFKTDRFLREGDEIKIGSTILKVLHTPGHTKGGICLLGENFIFTGDTIFEDGYGRTDLPGGSKEDLENSLQKLKKFLKPGITVYPGHGEIFENR